MRPPGAAPRGRRAPGSVITSYSIHYTKLYEFDLPSYHYWQHQNATIRQEALQGWLKPLTPLRDGLSIVLRLLRASGTPESQLAKGGSFQLMLGGSTSQMVRVSLKEPLPFVPEISANKYALNIRFIRQDLEARPRNNFV